MMTLLASGAHGKLTCQQYFNKTTVDYLQDICEFIAVFLTEKNTVDTTNMDPTELEEVEEDDRHSKAALAVYMMALYPAVTASFDHFVAMIRTVSGISDWLPYASQDVLDAFSDPVVFDHLREHIGKVKKLYEHPRNHQMSRGDLDAYEHSARYKRARAYSAEANAISAQLAQQESIGEAMMEAADAMRSVDAVPSVTGREQSLTPRRGGQCLTPPPHLK
jgi:hypothetical protein